MSLKRTAVTAVTAACVMALPAIAGGVTAVPSRVTMLGAISGPNLISVNATNGEGEVFIIAQTDNTIQRRGDVVCQSFDGNQAFVVYRDVGGTAGGYVRMEDNGPAGTDPVDKQNNGRLTASQVNALSSSCPVPTSGTTFRTLHTLLDGEVVFDNPPGSGGGAT
jgi:hypothetical protein